jgi:transcriptional regulator with XRE-family HTH domain
VPDTIPPESHYPYNEPIPETEEINPGILVWARETAGLSLEEAAEKLGLTSSSRSPATEKLTALETGNRAPASQQLQRAAAAYRRPLVAFYLDKPPDRGKRGEDFRTTPGSVSPHDNGILDALLRDLKARHNGSYTVTAYRAEYLRRGGKAVDRLDWTTAAWIMPKVGPIELQKLTKARGADRRVALEDR